MRKMHFTLIKNVDVIRRGFETNQIKIIPQIEQLKNETILFNNNEEVPIDCISFCTGYSTVFPFFKSNELSPWISDNRISLYKKIFHPKYPSLSFIGQIETLGPIIAITEIQSRLMAKVFAGKFQLPEVDKMIEDVEEDWKVSSMHRSFSFVPYVTYMDEIASLIGCEIKLRENEEEKVKNLYEDGPVFPSFYRYSGHHSKLFIPSFLSKL